MRQLQRRSGPCADFVAGARRLLTCVLAIAIALPLAPSAVAQGALTSEAARELARQRNMLEVALAGVDSSRIDLDAQRLDAAFMDAQELEELLASEYRFELYRGLLRGAEATFISRAGNALDLSFLLATLLEDAGYDARIALGSLTEADGERLLERVLEPLAAPERSSPDQVRAVAQAADVSVEDLEEFGRALAAVELEETAPYLEAQAASAALLDALAAAGVVLASDDHAALLAEAIEYAWVEYRLGDAAWDAIHPAFGALPAPLVVADEYIESAVPESLQHRLRVEVGIERKRGNEFFEEHIMTPWERPVANMFGVNLAVTNSPLDQPADATLKDLGTTLRETAFFVPLLNGVLAPGAMAFDTMGNLLSPADAANAMAGVFQTAASKMGQATGLLGALGTDAPADMEPFALTAQFVDVIHVAPGGAENRQRRYVFDRRGGAARVQGGAELLDESVLLNGILSSMEFMVTGASLPTDYLVDDSVQQGLRYLDAIERLAQNPDLGLIDGVDGLQGRDQLLLMALFEGVAPVAGGAGYRAAPTVVSIRQALTIGESVGGELGVDILHSSRRFLTTGPSGVVSDANHAVLAGAWDTMVERLYVERFAQGVDSAYSSFADGSGPLTVLTDVAELQGSGAPDAALPALQRDLAAGNVVVYASDHAASGTAFSWWRVDPATGTTLGIGSRGHGNAALEYLVPWQISLTVAGVLAVPGAMICASQSGDALIICLCDMVTGVVIFGSIGLAVGGALAGASAAVQVGVSVGMFVGSDIGLGTAMLTPLGGPCTWADRLMSFQAPTTCILG